MSVSVRVAGSSKLSPATKGAIGALVDAASKEMSAPAATLVHGGYKGPCGREISEAGRAEVLRLFDGGKSITDLTKIELPTVDGKMRKFSWPGIQYILSGAGRPVSRSKKGAVLDGSAAKSKQAVAPGYNGELAASALIEIRRRNAAGSGESFRKLATEEWLTTDGTKRRFGWSALRQAVRKARPNSAEEWALQYMGVGGDQDGEGSGDE